MGIYASEREEKQGDLLCKVVRWPGHTTRTYYQPVLVIDERDDCYCCSCGDREGDDPACRNHGWVGKRPCEDHDMPGSDWDDGLGLAGMPWSVQQERIRQETSRG